jgi:hypothetical protein
MAVSLAAAAMCSAPAEAQRQARRPLTGPARGRPARAAGATDIA